MRKLSFLVVILFALTVPSFGKYFSALSAVSNGTVTATKETGKAVGKSAKFVYTLPPSKAVRLTAKGSKKAVKASVKGFFRFLF